MREGRKVRKSSSEETESAKAGGKQNLCEAVGVKVSKCDVTRTKGAKEACRRRPHRGWNIRADILTLGSRNSRLSGKQRVSVQAPRWSWSPMLNGARSWKRSLSPKGENPFRFAELVCAKSTRRKHIDKQPTGLFVLRRLILEQNEKGEKTARYRDRLLIV